MVHKPTRGCPLYSEPSLPKFSQTLLTGHNTTYGLTHHHKLLYSELLHFVPIQKKLCSIMGMYPRTIKMVLSIKSGVVFGHGCGVGQYWAWAYWSCLKANMRTYYSAFGFWVINIARFVFWVTSLSSIVHVDFCQQGSILFTPKDFHFFSPSPNVSSQGIFVLKEDVHSNWTLKIWMTIFAFNAPFKGAKKIYVLIFQALVKTFFPPNSFVVHLDFATSELSQC